MGTRLWIETLSDWARKQSIEERLNSLGLHKSIANEYRKRVHQVDNEIYRFQEIAKTWRENSEEYSEFDSLVYSIYYSTLTRGHPARFFDSEIVRSLHREWLRSVRDLFTNDQIEGLHDEMLTTLANSAEPEFVDWNNAIPIDEAFTIDLLQSFDSVARNR